MASHLLAHLLKVIGDEVFFKFLLYMRVRVLRNGITNHTVGEGWWPTEKGLFST